MWYGVQCTFAHPSGAGYILLEPALCSRMPARKLKATVIAKAFLSVSNGVKFIPDDQPEVNYDI